MEFWHKYNFYLYFRGIKQFTSILLLLISLQGVAQKFADKEYYLVDSIVLKELSATNKQLIDSCLKVYHKAKEDTSKIKAIEFLVDKCSDDRVYPKYNLWVYHFVQEKIDSHPPSRIKKSLLTSLINALNNIGIIYNNQGDISLALISFHKSLKIQEKLEDKKGMATSFNNIGLIHKNQGDIPLALKYYHKGLKIQEELGDKDGMAYSYNNIGVIHYNQGDIPLALKYFHRSLNIQKELGNKRGMAYAYNNIGFIHQKQKDISLALTYYHKSLKIREEIKDKKGMATSFDNIGFIHRNQGDISLALKYFRKSLKIQVEIGDKKGITHSYNNIGTIYYNQGDFPLALSYGLKSLTLAQEIGYPDNIRLAANLLSTIYAKQGKGIKALKMYKLAITMQDSINNEATQKAAAHQQAKYEYEKQKAIDDAKYKSQLLIEQEKKEKQQILTYAAGGGLGLVVIFLIIVFNRLRVTKNQKLVIEIQKQEVEEQKKVVEEKNQEIMDSITYAKRIQSAILPPAKVVKEYLQESFILYKPKDIVAGDFYWMESLPNPSKGGANKTTGSPPLGESEGAVVLFAAADCTGHGVPGAMVSVVCNNGLNRSVREHGLTNPGEILDKTREIVIQEFEKSDEEVKDGMDIALCSLEGNKLQYAGANNPLWIIRKKSKVENQKLMGNEVKTFQLETFNFELHEVKADKQPIGQSDNPTPYTTHSFQLKKGDTIYIFSDGYVDQFGGEKDKKFKVRAFRELLLSIQDKAMEKQKTLIDEAFETWKGDLEQIDDVCIIGVKI